MAKKNSGRISPYGDGKKEDKPAETVNVASTTLEPTIKEKILEVLRSSPTRASKWWELVKACGPKATGDLTIQLDALGTRCSNIRIWYGVSQAFHDAIQELRSEQRIRLLAASPMGYFPPGTSVPLPIAGDFKVAYPQPHLFITSLELLS